MIIRGRTRHRQAILWTVLVVLMLSLPGNELPSFGDGFSLPEVSDKAAHAVLFFFESFFLLRSFRELGFFASRPRFWALGAAAILAVVTELVQLVVPGRSYEIADVGANLLGVALGAAWPARIESTTLTSRTA